MTDDCTAVLILTITDSFDDIRAAAEKGRRLMKIANRFELPTKEFTHDGQRFLETIIPDDLLDKVLMMMYNASINSVEMECPRRDQVDTCIRAGQAAHCIGKEA